MQLKNAVGIVTGAAQGLGLAFSKSILEGGGRVFLTDINDCALAEAAWELQARHSVDRVGYAKQDVTDDASFDAIFDAANKHFDADLVNLLVNNAGVSCKYHEFYSESTAWRKTIEVNLISVMRGTQVALHRLAKPGVIVNVASAAAFQPTPPIPEYGITKGAIVNFTQAIAHQVQDIRVTAFCPAFVDTPMGQVALKGSPQVVEAFGGLLTPEYTAEVFQTSLLDETNAGKALLVTPRHVGYHGDKP
ncbi:hypothetical protein SDRG_15685 [Saprolegnia diclina VS20]|uniref:Uncharacterized protein n=1 Tax=Saprolegnia diclina (strain VS20) TaxID=1156394 RepID=T0RAG2_SAPDV|nr:hypothetical protein SDRG_15685 [Saprolegnia diclina VS20]EQC26507.1 hypothetical protein SDRG_15685 [Saprolegnia diclina VS20]|eukprot:XP_008620086.1 hypothetical protein SDRG_15685 [Saprolegnia diclina VS20]